MSSDQYLGIAALSWSLALYLLVGFAMGES